MSKLTWSWTNRGKIGVVTMADADLLDAEGLHGVAEIVRLYAKDRPRWWHRFTKRKK